MEITNFDPGRKRRFAQFLALFDHLRKILYMAERIPNYELYGDLLAGGAPEPIHYEPLRERSSKHDWTIRLHRHRRLAQVFLFRSPGVFFSLGDVSHQTTQPTVLMIPSGVPHGFRFAEDVVGDVLSIRLDDVSDRLRDRFSMSFAPSGTIFPQDETPRFDDVVSLIDQLERAYHRIDAYRSDVMGTLVDLIVCYLGADQRMRSSPARLQAERRGRGDLQTEAFCALLEENFRQRWTVSDYATEIGLSAPHLTRICRKVLGAAPNALVRQRRVLEAKRLLEYTSLSLSEIAHRSGFSDAAFFSRTFKSHVGMPPNAYRAGLER